MQVQFKYTGQSGIVSGLRQSRVAFATNVLREPSYLNGQLGRPLVVRDALAALHRVVVSDLKYRPKDRLEFRLWLEAQDRLFLQSLAVKSESLREELEAKEARLAELRERRRLRLRPFYDARRKYFDYAYQNAYELDLLLDPVITVHPDELSFEAFSRDESTYARLAVKYDLFETIDAFECGTTNVDFSTRLSAQLDRMRTYRDTRFDLSPSGFGVAHAGDAAHKEKKIDLPQSWVNGFLQVQSVMSMSLARVRLEPIDLFNLVRFLRRHRARKSPRALRWELRPGERTRIVLEPWEHEIQLSPSSVYQGPKPRSIRTWGRRRFLVLDRLLPAVRRADVYLAGHGLPTVTVCDLGDATFTLGLSGWTDNDWTGQSPFSLLNRKIDVTGDQLAAAYHALREPRYATAEAIAEQTSMTIEHARSSLSFLCQAGRAMFDLAGGVFRHRDLFHSPFDPQKEVQKLAASAEDADPKAKAAKQIFEAGQARIIARRPLYGEQTEPSAPSYKISGSVLGSEGRVRPLLHLDPKGHIIEASCTCSFYKKFKLTKGPCEHILALRLAHMERLEKEAN